MNRLPKYLLIGAGALLLPILYFLVAAIYLDEVAIDLSANPPSLSEGQDFKNSDVKVLRLSSSGGLNFDGQSMDVAAFKKYIETVQSSDVENLTIIVRMYEDVAFAQVVDIKDMLDDAGVHALIEVISEAAP